MTYKKIGQIAHVSPSTVCKALSGSKEVSAELTQEIIRIAEELGYFEQKRKRKNEYAKSDMITIALICPEIISVFYAGIITSLKKEIEQRGGLTSVYVYDFDEKKLDKIVEQITVRNVADGIVMLSANCPKQHQSIPIVCLHEKELVHDSVFCDTKAYMSDMVGYLKELGHTDIAFVGEPKTEGNLKAFKTVMQTMQIPCPPENIYVLNERFEQIGYQAVEQMMKRNTLPTAVICAYDEVALAMIHSFTGYGVRIPEQVSIMGINDIPMAAYAQIPLSTVCIFQKEQAAIAINILYDKIFENAQITQHVSIAHRLIARNSTGPVPQKEK